MQLRTPLGILPSAPFTRSILLLIAGALNAASIAWPFHWTLVPGAPQWGLQLLSLAAFGWSVKRARNTASAFKIGTLFTTVWLSATFWWLFIAMHTYAGLHSVLAVFAVIALAAVLSVYYGIACAVFHKLQPNNPLLSAALFGVLWTAAELARGTWLTGFGWGAVGYAHADGPLGAVAPWIGVYGVTMVAASLSMFISSAQDVARKHLAAICFVLTCLALVPQQSFTKSTETISVTLLQGNIPQDQKFESGSGVPAALAWYASNLLDASTDLVVAPETAIPLLPNELPPGYWEALVQHFGGANVAMMSGIPLGDYGSGYTNSVVAISPKAPDAWRYDKHHLVPFGEFIPTFFKWFTRLMNIPLGDFNRGQLGQPPFEWGGQRLAPNICYEDLYGEELGVRFRDATRAPTILVNVSNMGWFGDSIAIDQHLQISRMRAKEFERPFIRATNTGATAIIDHHAKVTAMLPRLTQGVLVGQVEGRSGNTPYAWWVARMGLWPLWGVIALVLACTWFVRRGPSALTP